MSTIRQNQAPALIDGMTADLGGPRTAALLERLNDAVPWQTLAEPVGALYRVEAGKAGRRPWDPVLMLKCLLLQKWFGLSDPMLEEMLQDRLSFRRFVGLSLSDATPDETTFVVFRRRLREAKLDGLLFERALAHLDQQGLVVKEGTLVDATILEAPRGRAKTDDKGNKVGHTRDVEASFTKKHGRSYHGYKAHIASDRRGLIKGFVFDTAKVHDSRHFEALAADEPDGGSVWADSAYMDADRKARLSKRGIYCGIVKRRVRGQGQLPRHQQLINRLIASVRAVVEHPFAWLKQMGHGRVRYRGRRRNAFDFALVAVAYNFKRSLSLARPAT